MIQLNVVNERLQKAREDVARKTRQISALRLSFDQTEKERDGLRVRVESLEERLRRSQNESLRLENLVRELKSKLEGLQRDSSSQNEKLEEQEQRLRAELQRKERQVERLTVEVSHLQSRLLEEESSGQEARDRLNSLLPLEASSRSLQRKCDSLEIVRDAVQIFADALFRRLCYFAVSVAKLERYKKRLDDRSSPSIPLDGEGGSEISSDTGDLMRSAENLSMSVSVSSLLRGLLDILDTKMLIREISGIRERENTRENIFFSYLG